MSCETVLVIGAGPSGLRAAQSVAEIGVTVVLVEQREFLGGTPIAENYSGLTPRGEPARPQILRMVDEVIANDLINVMVSTELTVVTGEPGAFEVTLRDVASAHEERRSDRTIECGAIIVATGFAHFDPGRSPQMYGYYEFADVITQPELEGMLSEQDVRRPSTGEAPQRICFVQCVGSRDRQVGNEYCSKVCCGVASKQAVELRTMLPESKVSIFYIDMRTYGYWENQIYWPAQEQHHVQYVKGLVTEVLAKGDHLLVRGEDTTMGRPIEVPMDLVVLSVGMEPSSGTRELAAMLGVRQNKYGFIDAVAGPLDTVSTDREGIFACGASLGPADLEDSVSSAGAAASKAVGYLRTLNSTALKG